MPSTVAHPPVPDGAALAVHPLPSEGTVLENVSEQELLNFIHTIKVVLNKEVKPRNCSQVASDSSSPLPPSRVWVLVFYSLSSSYVSISCHINNS